uniref:(California timema) hypothetical protein n=1 Tax=Timema californicum TaxID=61474 RepID=A0A7R9JJC1_TIMCA|nr:unnamed protein product [Timema californicum]
MRQKLRLYRSITGIKWDLSVPDNIVKDIANKINNYVEPFCFDKNKDLVPKCLWNLLKQATKEDLNVGMDKDSCE